MDIALVSLSLLGFLLLVLGAGIWIFVGIFLVSFFGLTVLLEMPLDRVGRTVSSITFRYATTWELAAIPMFIWMGEIILRTDISTRLFRGLTPLVDRIPGRLLHVNVLGCTLFAAVSGSSAATTATVGSITIKELRARGYDRSLMLGSLAGAGSLGLLIPPSIVMIVYGILAEVSISRLFAAGVFPGLMIAFLYSVWIMFRAVASPEVSPSGAQQYSGRDRLIGSVNLLPIVALMVIVLGSIYSGLATPSEAAAVGVFSALVVVAALGQLSWRLIRDTLLGAVRTSCMVSSILVAAATLATTMGYLHVPSNVARFIAELGVGPIELIIILSAFYLLLGLFLDGVSIIVMSLPITLPLALNAGWDPVWFGVYLVLMVEMALVTPPVGFNLFVIQGLSGDPLGRVALAAVPFFFLMALGVVILMVVPDIALWLPRLLYE